MTESGQTKASPPSGDLPRLGKFVARHRRHPVMRKMAGLCRRYLNWYGNLSYDLVTNGEARILEVLASFEPRVLVDAGANVGGWSIEASAFCPNAEIHAFEIARPTFETLKAKTRHLP